MLLTRSYAVYKTNCQLRAQFIDLRHVLVTEMHLTRIMMASLLSDTNEDHQALVRYTRGVMQTITRNSDLLSDEELRELEEKEAVDLLP